MKIKFNSEDDLPLNKPLKLHAVTISIRSVFEEDGKLYLQVFLDGGFSTALRCGSFSKKTSKKSTSAIMIRINVTFANQILL